MQTRRTALANLLAMGCLEAMAGPCLSQSVNPKVPVATGADLLAASGFAVLAGKRIGLITNQTGRVGETHLADLLAQAPNVKVGAILAPEHGFRGTAEAGASVRSGVDQRTGAPIHSLYGATKTPTRAMLRGLDVLVFDIQDIGVRSYTYISTMGLAMQAAATARIPFVVLDRPNPLGGVYVSGFVLEPTLRTFVGQYPIPIVHGLTVGELAQMIKGERWLDGLDTLDLTVVELRGWQRSMRWPQTQRPWVATSPNIPTFESALVYPGIGFVGELDVNEGRGTLTPFSLFGAPWVNGRRLVTRLNAIGLPGATFEVARYSPRSIRDVATNPRYVGETVNGARVVVTDIMGIAPLELGMHVLAALAAEARADGNRDLFVNPAMFRSIAGTERLHRMLARGADGATIVAAWQGEVERFKAQRARYLLY